MSGRDANMSLPSNGVSLASQQTQVKKRRKRNKKSQAQNTIFDASPVAQSNAGFVLNPFLLAIQRAHSEILQPTINELSANLSQLSVVNQVMNCETNVYVQNPFLFPMQAQHFTNHVQEQVIKVPLNLSILNLDKDANTQFNIHEITLYEDVPISSPKYKMIKKMFPSKLTILKIQQVFNPFLRLSFQLKQHYVYCDREPMRLFHGTKLKYVHNICTYNFDWRYNGAERGHKYGKGVNFTPRPDFAVKFGDKNSNRNVVILADVLVTNTCLGNGDMEVPPCGYDTSIRDNGIAYVKFSDAEFYPAYVIFFCKKCS